MGHVRLVTFQFASVRKRRPTVEKRAYMRMETGSGFSWKLNIAFVYVCMLFIPKQQSSSYTTCCAYFWKTVVLIFIFHILSMHICMLMLSRTILLWIFHEYFPYTITWEINSKYFLSNFFLLLMGVCIPRTALGISNESYLSRSQLINCSSFWFRKPLQVIPENSLFN